MAQATSDSSPDIAPASPPATPNVNHGKAPAAKPGGKLYIIGPLDVLYVRVWDNVNLTGAVDVRPDGMISMQLIGEIKADGLTAEQLKDAIAQRLTEYVNNPVVDVQVARINSKKIFIYGGVLRAGAFPLIERTTVMDALASAGGFKEFANTKKIEVHRGTKKFLFNYKDVSKGKNLEQDIELEPGDRIIVPE
jgi:polysaccharide biosynthesis/export protein